MKENGELAALRALRDQVIDDYRSCKEANDEDAEWTTRGGNGVNSSEALSALEPLYEQAVKIER